MEVSFQSMKGASSRPGIPEGGESVTALPLPGQGTVRLCGPAQQTAMQTFFASSLSGREPHNLELIL